MVFTTREFIEYSNVNITKNNSPDQMRNAMEGDKLRRKKELAIVTKTKPCTLESSVYSNLDHIKDGNLSQLYNDQFYSEGFMRYLSEMSCPIFYPMASNGSIVKEWLKNFKKIGAESVEGVAIMASLTDDDKLFIIKGPRGKSSDLAHEAVIGLALNPLRATIPNFSWVFGVLRCSMPITDDDKLLSWCNANDPVTYVVYERVPGVSLRDYIRTATPLQFADVFLQICEALHVASKHCDFTHYDLHYENVIVRPLDKSSTIVYNIDQSTYYHTTSNIATFIDYGFSHAIYNNEHYGRYDFKGFSIYPNQGYPMFDVFKLLCFCLEASLNTQLAPIMTQMLQYFTRDNALDVIKNTGINSGYYYCLPYQLGSAFKLSHFIEYIINITKPSFISLNPTSSSKILSCSMSGTCLNTDAIAKFMGVNHENESTSLVGYKIALEHGNISKQNYTAFKELFQKKLYYDGYNDIKNETTEISNLLQQTKPLVAFSNITMANKNIKDPKTRKMYRSYVNRIIDMISKYNHIIDLYFQLIYIMSNLGYDAHQILSQKTLFIKAFRLRMMTFIDRLLKDIAIFKNIAPYHQNPELSWFFTILPNYTDALVLYE